DSPIAEVSQELEAVHGRHLEVDDQECRSRGERIQHGERLLPIARLVYLRDTQLSAERRGELSLNGTVVDDQHRVDHVRAVLEDMACAPQCVEIGVVTQAGPDAPHAVSRIWPAVA